MRLAVAVAGVVDEVLGHRVVGVQAHLAQAVRSGLVLGQSDLVAAASRTEVEARLLPFAFEAGLLGVRAVEEAGDAPALSLLSRVSASAPPFLVAHGDRDHVVLPSQGLALHDALARAGAQTCFQLLGGAGHEGPEFDAPAFLAATAAWLRATLVGPVP